MPDMAAIWVWNFMSAAMKASESPRAPRCSATVALSRSTSSAVAFSAASLTMPRSKKMRAFLRCSSVSFDDDRMILAAPSTCLMIDLAVNCSTLARSPCEIATSPILLSACIASRIAGLPTSKRSISSRSDGMSSPGCNSPLVIRRFSLTKTSSESLRRTIGSERFIVANHSLDRYLFSIAAMIPGMPAGRDIACNTYVLIIPDFEDQGTFFELLTT
ncbi:hypothetical protein MESS2_80034 [Mesorhizobium metallidurans STM 2683]|uniref:Uncharacterized protein n=1 Tax=Mesorhizobium metallidurans STM 2683 TaxID=1297569 RepID=M5EY25_9HYPH|nr:hypothetical protein MESS2_80034 [Mesorhizobium metallidurans STM 2683]